MVEEMTMWSFSSFDSILLAGLTLFGNNVLA